MKKAGYCLLVILMSASLSMAQVTNEFSHLVGGTTHVWKFTPRTNHHDAVVRVSVGKASGTGTIVAVDRNQKSGNRFEGYCLTAHHVVRERPESSEIKIHFQDGRVARNCRVVAFDEEYDAALLQALVPYNTTSAAVAKEPATGLDPIEFCGLGGNSKLKCCLRTFSAAAALPTTENQLFADVSLLPGDSGGPVFNSQGELTGVISGGWFWWEAGVKDKRGEHVMATWPARAANSTVLQKLLTQARATPTESHPGLSVAISE